MNNQIIIKIMFNPIVRNLYELLNILMSIKGNVYIQKVNDNRRVKNTIIGLSSLNLHLYDSIYIMTDNNNINLQDIKRRIEMIGT